MKTQAAVLYEVGQPLVLEEIELDAPKQGEVLVRVGGVGVCHSDVNTMSGAMPHPLPVVLGHEGAGVVAEVGAGVTRVKEGDHVILSWNPGCGVCYLCVRGQSNLCNSVIKRRGKLADGTGRLHKGEQAINHYLGVSCHATDVVVPEQGIIGPIRADVPLEVAALFGCAVITGVGAVWNAARLRPGDTIAIFGTGGIGLNAIQGAALLNAGAIIAVDLLENKLAYARQFGATHTINAAETDPIRAIREITANIGVDYAIEAIGNPAVIAQAYKATRRGGTTVVVGLAPFGKEIALPAFTLPADEKTVRGSFYGSNNPRTDIPRLIDLYVAGRLKIEEQISRRYPFAQINEAYTALERGEVARSVLTFG